MPDAHEQADRNLDRVMVRVIKAAASRLGVRVEPLGEGWILRLVRDARGDKPAIVRHIHGYSFDLNPAAAHEICCDKAATAQVLENSGIACVPHALVLHPEMARFVPMSGSWGVLLGKLGAWGGDVVVKENTGTGGRGVTRCGGVIPLEQAVYKLFEKTQSVAVCPFVEILHEYRFVMLRGACELAYEKVRASVVGDGCKSVVELLCDQKVLSRGALAALLENLDDRERRALADVPGRGDVRLLNWRHNLGQGATARVLDAREARALPAWEIARDAARALGLVFGSVDVVQCANTSTLPERWAVLEVNSGVMMEFLARSGPAGDAITRRVYEHALAAMFE